MLDTCNLFFTAAIIAFIILYSVCAGYMFYIERDSYDKDRRDKNTNSGNMTTK